MNRPETVVVCSQLDFVIILYPNTYALYIFSRESLEQNTSEVSY